MSPLRHALAAAVLLGGFLVSNSAFAQLGEFRPVSASYERQLGVGAAGGTISFDTFRIGAGLPVPINKTSFLVVGLNYQLINIDFQGSKPLGLDQLHLLTVSPMVIHQFSKNWLGIFGTTYGMASNFGGPVSGQDFFYSANAIAIYSFAKEFTVGAGIGFDSRTGSLLPLPLGVVNWEPRPDFAIRGVAPALGAIAWRPVKPITLELTEALDGQRYHLSDSAYAPHKDALAYSLLKLGGGARFHFGKWIHLEALGGVVVLRRFETFKDEQSQGSEYLPPGPFFGLNLWFGTSGWNSDAPAPAPKEKK